MTLFKLQLRDFFWLVVLVAMGVGWWLDRTIIQDQLTSLQTGFGAKLDKRLSYMEAFKLLDDLRSEGPPWLTTEQQKRRMEAILKSEQQNQGP